MKRLSPYQRRRRASYWEQFTIATLIWGLCFAMVFWIIIVAVNSMSGSYY